jgi:hypothetical protein
MELEPNLHFAFMQRNEVYTQTTDHRVRQVVATAYNRDSAAFSCDATFSKLLDSWLAESLVSEDDLAKIDESSPSRIINRQRLPRIKSIQDLIAMLRQKSMRLNAPTEVTRVNEPA